MKKSMQPKQFSQTLINWQKEHGRHHLPWQVAEPYARWVSEIMLQQTQVATVIEYYERFMRRFPTVQSLAQASEDEVMQYWSGLGYYSRARNLLKSAQIIVNEKQAHFPQTRLQWEALPGIGRSTAAAIVAFSFGAKETILDGNVKRVLARLFCIESPLDEAKTVKELWTLAESLLPDHDLDAYIQGLMDMGATVCTRSPKCVLCPFQEDCKALKAGLQNEIPVPRKRQKRPQQERTFLILWSEDECFLQKRTEGGVWKGLYCLPEREGILTPDEAQAWAEGMGYSVRNTRKLSSFAHNFSHYRLILHPIAVSVTSKIKNDATGQWVRLADLPDIGLPAPIRSLLGEFFA